MTDTTPTGAPPIGVLAALVTIVLDLLWGTLELGETASVAGLPLVVVTMLAAGISCWLAVTLAQHYIENDAWGSAISKGLIMGIIAGVPYSVVGTAVGVVLLGWAGIHGLSKKKIKHVPETTETE
ncbi:MAG: hypothetical protein R6X06_11655 [Gammaproteobacteria bacterium]